MKVYNLPQVVKGIIFDIDSTLYDCPQYAFEQVDIQVRHFAHLRGMTEESARTVIGKWRREWSAAHGGKKISLGNTLLHFGISIEESIKWRETLLEPKYYLHKDEKLHQCLLALKKKFRLICVTNNPVLPAKKTLEAIGAEDIFCDGGGGIQCFARVPWGSQAAGGIVGLDTCKVSKGAKEPFEKALKVMGFEANECVSVGDRYDMDIAPPIEMGMGGILVDGVKDVMLLEGVLTGC